MPICIEGERGLDDNNYANKEYMKIAGKAVNVESVDSIMAFVSKMASIERNWNLLTPEMIDALLTDNDYRIVHFTIINPLLKLTEAQIERGLTDERWQVRAATINKKDVFISKKQYNRGLKDDVAQVAMYYGLKYHSLNAAWEAEKLKKEFVKSTKKIVNQSAASSAL